MASANEYFLLKEILPLAPTKEKNQKILKQAKLCFQSSGYQLALQVGHYQKGSGKQGKSNLRSSKS